MKINIGISEENRQKAATELSKLLADEYVLFTKTKEAHWNIEGIDFYDKHKLFDEQAEQLSGIIDSVAERIRTLGNPVPATLKAFLELTHLTENELLKNDSRTFISELLIAHETVINHLRENIELFANEYGDSGSSDFITSLMQEHEKTAWILRTHLK
jgi:starvation-inducible DNA-binding protein